VAGRYLRIEVLRNIPEDAELRHGWNALASSVEQPQVFYTWEWAQAVVRAYSATLHPWLLLAYDQTGRLCGVAPLATDAAGEHASFLGATTGDYCDFLSAPEQRPALVGAVLGELKRQKIRRVTLTNLPADSATVPVIRQMAGQYQLHCHIRTAYVCAQVELAALSRRGDHNPVLPRKKMLRRFLNAMGRENPVRLDHARTWTEISARLPDFMEAHVARFLVTGRISNMARPERQLFLLELAKLLSESGAVVLTRMMSGDRVFAWNYGFQFQGTWFWYQPTFDSDLEKYSPGFCLLAKVIEEAADNPAFQIVDMGLGAEEYKERFANRSRETVFVSLRRSVAEHYGEMLRDRLSATIRRSRPLELAVRSSVAWLIGKKQFFTLRGVTGASRAVGTRLRSVLWSKTETCFYEWGGSAASRNGQVHIRRLELKHLAAAAMRYVDDAEAPAYLLAATLRLRAKAADGYVLLDSAGTPLHFAWVGNFETTLVPALRAHVSAFSSEALLLADCWTPAAMRGQGYCVQALDLIAEAIRASGRTLWACGEPGHGPWARALVKAGFRQRYSLIRASVLWRRAITRRSCAPQEQAVEEVPAA